MLHNLALLALAFTSTPTTLVPSGTRLPLATALLEPPLRAKLPVHLRGGNVALVATPIPAGALLAVTIALEVAATTCMKLAASNSLWNIGVFSGYIACFSLFPLVLRSIPLNVAYAIWSGCGTAATCLVGSLLFGETVNARKLLCLALIILGVVGLNVAGE